MSQRLRGALALLSQPRARLRHLLPLPLRLRKRGCAREAYSLRLRVAVIKHAARSIELIVRIWLYGLDTLMALEWPETVGLTQSSLSAVHEQPQCAELSTTDASTRSRSQHGSGGGKCVSTTLSAGADVLCTQLVAVVCSE